MNSTSPRTPRHVHGDDEKPRTVTVALAIARAVIAGVTRAVIDHLWT